MAPGVCVGERGAPASCDGYRQFPLDLNSSRHPFFLIHIVIVSCYTPIATTVPLLPSIVREHSAFLSLSLTPRCSVRSSPPLHFSSPAKARRLGAVDHHSVGRGRRWSCPHWAATAASATSNRRRWRRRWPRICSNGYLRNIRDHIANSCPVWLGFSASAVPLSRDSLDIEYQRLGRGWLVFGASDRCACEASRCLASRCHSSTLPSFSESSSPAVSVQHCGMGGERSLP